MAQHDALTGHTPKSTPQSEPIPGSSQVPNSAGGFTWEVDVWDRVKRFLILGVEGGTFYIGQRQLVTENTQALDEALKQDGRKLVKLIVEISDSGRAASNDPALFALAYAAKNGDLETRKVAHDALPLVARIGTHLFHWIEYVKALGGFGRGTRRAIANWYTGKSVDKLAFQVVKYRQRDGWSHRDLLRKSHPKVGSGPHSQLFRWVTEGMPDGSYELPEIAEAYIKAQRAKTPGESAELIIEYGLPRECIQTEHLNSAEVWEALLERMPYTATLRNLGTMSANGLLKSMSEKTRLVTDRLVNREQIEKSRVHPIAILAALKTYSSGGGFRSSKTWDAVREIVDALDAAFYVSFGNVEPTGQRLLLALDVSGSMSSSVNGIEFLSAREVSAAMALITANVEDRYEIVGFTGGSIWHRGNSSPDDLKVLNISPHQRLDDVVSAISGLPFGATDCSLPMRYASANDREFDAFFVYTDNETWVGGQHPSQALADYRRQTGIGAKLCVVGTASNGFTIADPQDPGMLDLVGFDTATPNIMSEFVRGL